MIYEKNYYCQTGSRRKRGRPELRRENVVDHDIKVLGKKLDKPGGNF
jgi:hypothetical protein